MSIVTVGMSALEVSADRESVLVTYALGSCIAVVIHDPLRSVGGMIHYQLPLSSVSPDKASQNPAMFADTGVPILFQRMYSLAARKQDLIVKVVGGASICDAQGTFEIGKRNYVTLRKLLWKAGVPIAAEDVGGSASRTVRLSIKDGCTTVRTSSGKVTVL